MYYVYILRCFDNSLYTGVTNDVLKRYKKHQEGHGAKYTRAHKPISIEFVIKCDTKSEALKLERKIKSLLKSQKEKLILLDDEVMNKLEIQIQNIEKSNL